MLVSLEQHQGLKTDLLMEWKRMPSRRFSLVCGRIREWCADRLSSSSRACAALPACTAAAADSVIDLYCWKTFI